MHTGVCIGGRDFFGEENTKNYTKLKMGRKKANLAKAWKEDMDQVEAGVSKDPALLFEQGEVEEGLIMCEPHWSTWLSG